VELVPGVSEVAPPFLVKGLAVGLSIATCLVVRWSALMATATLGQANGRTPIVPDVVPYIGHVKAFGENLLRFLVEQRRDYGDIFRARFSICCATWHFQLREPHCFGIHKNVDVAAMACACTLARRA
jgi:hypothetical protein